MTESWTRFRRVGEVRAERRTVAWQWTTTSGETMQANAGDWSVSDSHGHEWSVADAFFDATYEKTTDDRYRRLGTVRARPAVAGEVVQTLEGDAEARAGEWVVEGSAGEQWPVPGDQFRERYEQL